MPKPRIGLSIDGPASEIYTISDFLGHGAFGEVYRAVGNSTGNVVAVKLLPVAELSDERSALALLNEMNVAMTVVHPNVVQVLFVRENHGDLGPYVMMEYVAGGTLAGLLKKNRQSNAQIPMPQVLSMMMDIAQGCRAINSKVIHRDIKPDNILHDGAHLKIGDFGISKFVEESTRTRTFKGGQHVAYMAPEGWDGSKNTFKIDVYSVGIVFHQIVCLSHPFEKAVADVTDWRSWERAHLFQSVPDVRNARKDVPVSVAQLIQRMASKRASDRPAWDEILSILSTPEEPSETHSAPPISAAVDAALRRKSAIDQARLKAEEETRAESKKNEVYFHACRELIGNVESIVDAFNKSFQHGNIATHLRDGIFDQLRGVRYAVPNGQAIFIEFFDRRDTGMNILSGTLSGGGVMGVEKGPSANLLRICTPDDMYGKWWICEVDLMALANPQRLIGQYGLRSDTVVPFGFTNAQHFYDQIRYAASGMHVFTYKFREDVKNYFSELLTHACQ